MSNRFCSVIQCILTVSDFQRWVWKTKACIQDRVSSAPRFFWGGFRADKENFPSHPYWRDEQLIYFLLQCCKFLVRTLETALTLKVKCQWLCCAHYRKHLNTLSNHLHCSVKADRYWFVHSVIHLNYMLRRSAVCCYGLSFSLIKTWCWSSESFKIYSAFLLFFLLIIWLWDSFSRSFWFP